MNVEQLAIECGVIVADEQTTVWTNNNAIEVLERFGEAYHQYKMDKLKANTTQVNNHEHEFLVSFNYYHGTNFTQEDLHNVQHNDDTEFAYGKKWAKKLELALLFYRFGYYRHI